MRCDLHVHSTRSGAVDLPVLNRFGNECYSEPGAVYERARRRGMDLVTLTDHDTIAGALEIASLPGTFVSEEVTCELPGGRKIHLGVWDIDEAQHEPVRVGLLVGRRGRPDDLGDVLRVGVEQVEGPVEVVHVPAVRLREPGLVGDPVVASELRAGIDQAVQHHGEDDALEIPREGVLAGDGLERGPETKVLPHLLDHDPQAVGP